MIQRFRFGSPLPTDSVVQELPVSEGAVPFLTAEADGGWSGCGRVRSGRDAPRHQ